MVTASARLLVVLVVLGAASVASAQASALGSPYPPGTRSVAPATTTPGVETPIAPMAPRSYSDVQVPIAPATSMSIYPAPRGVMLADSPDVHIPTSIATRLRVLDADLQILSMRGNDYFGPIVSLVLGGVSLGVAIWADTSSALGSTSWIPAYLYTTAGGTIARAVLSLVFMTNPSGAAIRYAHMPMGTMRDIRERLRYGELQLDSLADMARIGRILDGSISLATGLAVLPIVLGIGTFQVSNFFGWLALIFGAVQAVVGVVSLASTTEAERRQSAYHELRDRLLATETGSEDDEMLERAAADQAASQVTLTPTASVDPTGAFAGATVTF